MQVDLWVYSWQYVESLAHRFCGSVIRIGAFWILTCHSLWQRGRCDLFPGLGTIEEGDIL